MRRPAIAIAAVTALGAAIVLGAPACSSSSSTGPVPATPVAQASNAAVAVVTAGGAQKAYVYYGPSVEGATGQVAVVDVALAGSGAAGVPARLKLIDIPTTDFGLSVAGSSAGVVAASVVRPEVYFLDPAADTYVATLDLASRFLQPFGPADRDNMMISGLALDPGAKRLYLSVFNGVEVVDTQTRTIVGHFDAPPTENMALDVGRGWLLLPHYGCLAWVPSPPPGWDTFCARFHESGMNLVDVRTGVSYAYENPAAPGPDSPLGVEPDGVSVDAGTGLAVVGAEGTNALFGLDLALAQLDASAKTFTAPRRSVENPPPVDGAAVTTPLSAAAVAHGGAWAIAAREFSAVVGITPGSALKGSGAGSMLLATMPDLPDGSAWVNRGDPHGVTVATIGGKECAVLVNQDQTWLARIDLAALAGLSHAAPNALTAAEAAPAITYLDMTRAR